MSLFLRDVYSHTHSWTFDQPGDSLMKPFQAVAALAAILLLPCAAQAAFIPDAGGQTLATAQFVPTPSAGNPTIITRGITGDATWVASGAVTTAPGGADQDLSFFGALPQGSNFTLATAGIFEDADGTAEQFSDATFTTSVFFDDDDGPGLYPEFRDGEVTSGPFGDVHIRFGEFDSDAEITYGYDILSTAASNGLAIDFYRVVGLLPGSSFSADLQSDGATFGFFDGFVRILDSAGTELASADDSALGSRPNKWFAEASAPVPGDGIVYVTVHPYGDDNYDGLDASGPGGTFQVELNGTPVPEPGTFAIAAMIGLAFSAAGLRRRWG